MAKDKSMMVTERTLAIFKRSVIAENAANINSGEDALNLKTFLEGVAEDMAKRYNFTDLPDKPAS